MDAFNPVTTYRCYRPNPFTPKERKNVTILYGGLQWRAERLLQAVFANNGYNAKPLPPATREDLEKGRELIDMGHCCPTAFTTGNLMNFLSQEKARIGEDALIENYVFVTAGSCRSCRFGQYHQSYELALRNLGLDAFRMYFMEQGKLKPEAVPGGGLDFSLPLMLGAAFATMCADIIQDFEYQVRPYEVVPGATDKAVLAAIDELYQAILNRPIKGYKLGSLLWHLSTNYYANALRKCRRHFDDVEVDRLRIKAKVKITGEFYVKTVEGDPNYNIHHWLEEEGGEVSTPLMAVWFDYLIRCAAQEFEQRQGIVPGANAKFRGLRVLSWLVTRAYNKLRAAFLNIPQALPDQYKMRKLSDPFYDHRMSGGEGDLLIGEAIWSLEHKEAHMICELSPYACMPNTMSTGAMAMAMGQYPDILYAPLEIKGDSEVHTLSRCQMILTEAKERAQNEFDKALKLTGLTLEEAKSRLARHPELRKSLCKVEHRGAVGTAANVVLELGGRTF